MRKDQLKLQNKSMDSIKGGVECSELSIDDVMVPH